MQHLATTTDRNLGENTMFTAIVDSSETSSSFKAQLCIKAPLWRAFKWLKNDNVWAQSKADTAVELLGIEDMREAALTRLTRAAAAKSCTREEVNNSEKKETVWLMANLVCLIICK